MLPNLGCCVAVLGLLGLGALLHCLRHGGVRKIPLRETSSPQMFATDSSRTFRPSASWSGAGMCLAASNVAPHRSTRRNVKPSRPQLCQKRLQPGHGRPQSSLAWPHLPLIARLIESYRCRESLPEKTS